MRNSKLINVTTYPPYQFEQTNFNIFMSGPELCQPIVRAQDIVKNLMDKRQINKFKNEQERTDIGKNNKYP